MTTDVEHLPPGPDLDAIDFAKLDRGDTVPDNTPDPAPAPAPAPAPLPEDKAVDAPPVDKAAEPAADDAGGEKKGDEPPARDDKGRFIPKARFDEQVNKEREAKEIAERRAADAEAKLAEIQRGQQKQAQDQQRTDQLAEIDKQLDELEAKKDAALLEGDTEKAAELNKEIRQLNRQYVSIETRQGATQVVSQEFEERRLDAVIARLEADYPVLNQKSEEFDPDVVGMILLAQRAAVERGVPPSQAMFDAAQGMMAKLAKLRGDGGKKDEPAVDKSLADAAKPDDRTKKAVEKALDTASKQPATVTAVGADSDKHGMKELPDVRTMTAEEFAALPETTRARLRGDML